MYARSPTSVKTGGGRGFRSRDALPYWAPMETQIRDARDGDGAAMIDLASRLAEGVAPWRDETAVRRAVRNWVADSFAERGQPDHAAFVAEREGEVVGFVCVSERAHFAGTIDTYIGELVVSQRAEGTGIGRALVEEAMTWGRRRGRVRVVVDTGAANRGARDFYAALGFDDEDVTLSKGIV